MAERKPVGWGIVGFGWVARDYMAPAILAAGDRLVAIFDPDPSARSAAAALGARAVESLQDLLDDDAVEVIYVATPNHLHRPAVEAAARSGKAVLCEKPMAASLADAEAMAAAVAEAGILYGTSHRAHAKRRPGEPPRGL